MLIKTDEESKEKKGWKMEGWRRKNVEEDGGNSLLLEATANQLCRLPAHKLLHNVTEGGSPSF